MRLTAINGPLRRCNFICVSYKAIIVIATKGQNLAVDKASIEATLLNLIS